MQHDDLDREQAICDAATAGPWEVSPDPEEWAEYDNGEALGISMATAIKSPSRYHTHHRIDAYDSIYPEDAEWESAVANLRFIAEARTAWPARIEECRRLREREAALLAEIERLKAAGEVLAETTRTNWAGEISRKEDEACRVFEERK